MVDGDGEDALKGVDEIKSGDESGEPVHSPTIPEDEGNPGEGGEGVAGPASGTTTADGDEDDLTS
jgi:hypothetical protein